MDCTFSSLTCSFSALISLSPFLIRLIDLASNLSFLANSSVTAWVLPVDESASINLSASI